MGLKFLNFELQMRCVVNCKKINLCIGNQQRNKHLHFPGQHYSFQGFFQTFPYLWSFSRFFEALKIYTSNSRTFHTFPGSVRTLCLLLVWTLMSWLLYTIRHIACCRHIINNEWTCNVSCGFVAAYRFDKGVAMVQWLGVCWVLGPLPSLTFIFKFKMSNYTNLAKGKEARRSLYTTMIIQFPVKSR